MSSNKITRRRDVSTLQAPLLALLLSLTRLLTTSKPPNIKLDTNFSIKMSLREHIHMTSDFWLCRHVKLHLMISDVGRWVGQRGSAVRYAIFEFLLLSVY